MDWLAAEMLKYNVKPEIEAFDLSHIFQAVKMQKDKRLKGPLYIQFVMGVKNAMPVDRHVFDFYVKTVERIAPDATWCGAGVGANQIVLNEWSIAAGGHTRTGLEDNIRLGRGTLAPSNAALVMRATDLCEKYERPVASWQQAREIFRITLKTINAESLATLTVNFDGKDDRGHGFINPLQTPNLINRCIEHIH